MVERNVFGFTGAWIEAQLHCPNCKTLMSKNKYCWNCKKRW